MHTDDEEIKHLDKHEEVASQFDYSYSQVNQPEAAPVQAPTAQVLAAPVGPTIAPSVPQLISPNLAPSAPATNARMLAPKYWLSLGVVLIPYIYVLIILPDGVGRLLGTFVYISAAIATSGHIQRLRIAGKDSITESDKFKIMFYDALNPLLSQAMYRFRLRKVLPGAAKTASKIGWKTFFIWLVYVILVLIVASSLTWTSQNGPAFDAAEKSIRADLLASGAAAKNDNLDVMKQNCEKIATDIKQLKQLPAYPDSKIQSQLSSAETDMTNGANDCAMGANNNDGNQIIKAGGELKTGGDGFHAAVTAMNSTNK